MADTATDRGRTAVKILTAAGRKREFDVLTEYPVPGGRIDVVWTLPTPGLPGHDGPLPIVGFEVESSCAPASTSRATT